MSEKLIYFNLLSGFFFGNENKSLTETGQLDWEYIYITADQNFLIPVIAQSIQNNKEIDIPLSILENINNRNREIIASNLFKINELRNIQSLFKSDGIDSIILKGPGLGESVYGDASIRQFGDLDILVKKSQVREAAEIIKNNGYEFSFDLTEEQKIIYENSPLYLKDLELHYPFYNPAKNINIELHWALMPEKYSFSQDVDELFNNSREIEIKEQTFNVLNNEDCLIFLSQHGAKHCWSMLLWIFDIAALLNEKNNINWELVIAKSEELNSKRSVLLSVYLANKLFSCEIPRILKYYFEADKLVSVLGDIVVENYEKGYGYKKIEADNKKFFFRSMENPMDKFRYISALIFKPTIYELEFVALPKELSFLYYLIRPVRLIRKYISKVFPNN